MNKEESESRRGFLRTATATTTAVATGLGFSEGAENDNGEDSLVAETKRTISDKLKGKFPFGEVSDPENVRGRTYLRFSDLKCNNVPKIEEVNSDSLELFSISGKFTDRDLSEDNLSLIVWWSDGDPEKKLNFGIGLSSGLHIVTKNKDLDINQADFQAQLARLYKIAQNTVIKAREASKR